jgi:hypothetical protein
MKFLLGAVCGAGVCYLLMTKGILGIKQQASIAVESTRDMAKSYCRKNYLLETQCFQHHAAIRCEQLMKEKCGE